MAKSKFVKVNEKIAEGAVGGFNRMADTFVENFLTKEGESVEEARERLATEQKEREASSAAEKEKCSQDQKEMIERSLQNSHNASKEARRKAGLE